MENNLSIIVLLSLFLGSCVIEVKSYGDYWDKGYVDQKLEGNWEGYLTKDGVSERNSINDHGITISGDQYIIGHGTGRYYGRSIEYKNHYFIMAKDQENKMNSKGEKKSYPMVKYEIIDGKPLYYICGDFWNNKIIRIKELNEDIFDKIIDKLENEEFCYRYISFKKRNY